MEGLGYASGRDKCVVGYTSGVFDLLHDGHRKYLQECKLRCDFLIVGVDEDALVTKIKGPDRPFQTCETRLSQLSVEGVGSFFFKKKTSFESIIINFKPHKYFIPNNRNLQASRLNLIENLNIELVMLPYTSGISTSLIARKMHDDS